MEKIIQIQTAVDTIEAAESLAQAALNLRLAACAQYYPLQSMYHWQGKIEKAAEITVIFKTRSGLAGRLLDFIKQNHSYQVPEILIRTVCDSNLEYQQWVNSETVENNET